MAYVSLYRKYRSQTFSDLIGQDHVVRTLQNAISSNRIAQSFLFTGPRGTGKTSSARLLAKALCCEKGPGAEPCNECSICLSITDGSCMDVYEMDAASEAGVDEVRETIVQVVEYKPAIARYKVFIIDEVHDLSNKAFDALLKTIEEPPSHIIFILATTEYNKVPPTIRSRCQKFEFHRASLQDLIKRLEFVAQAEGVQYEPAAISAIARMADGGYRDALTLLEQSILTSEGSITLQGVYDQLGLVGEEVADDLLLAIKEGNIPKILELSAELTRLGRDPRSILESLLYRLSDLTRVAYGVDAGATPDAMRDASTHERSVQLGQQTILALRGMLADAHKVIRDISLPRLWLEFELVRISQALNAPVVAPVVKSTNGHHQATQPEVKRQAPVEAAAKPEPSATAVVEAKPAPEPVAVTPEPAKEQEEVPPELVVPNEAWKKAVAELSSISKTMAMKLDATLITAAKEDGFVVCFGREMDRDWVLESPKREAAIRENFEKHFGKSAPLTLDVRKSKKKHDEPVAVELPAEGEKLYQLAQQVLGKNRS